MSTITHKGNISVARIVLAFFTCGLSLPFAPIRPRRGKSVIG